MNLDFLRHLYQAGPLRDGPALARPLSWRPTEEISRYAPLPHVMPLLDQLASGMPHIRVSASRAGARVLPCPADGDGEDIEVEGEQQVHEEPPAEGIGALLGAPAAAV